MSIELMFIIIVFLVVAAIILWPMLKTQPPAKQYSHRLPRGSLMSHPTSRQRFGYRQLPPVHADDDHIVEGADTVPAVIDVVELALRVGHKLVEGTHPDPEAAQTGCADLDRVDETGEPLTPHTGASVCRSDPETSSDSPVTDLDEPEQSET